MSCNSAAKLKFWLQTDLRREIQPTITGREDSCFWLCSPWSRVGHALRPMLMLWLFKIWQVSSCGKFMQHLEFCLLWQPKLTFMASLFIRFLVEKYVACQSRKSDFGWHRFRFSPCLDAYVRRLQSLKRYWPYLIPFRAASRMVSLSNYFIWCLIWPSIDQFWYKLTEL